MKQEPGADRSNMLPTPEPADLSVETDDDDGQPSATTARKERKPVSQRRRVVASCSECRRRKIKCDKKYVDLRGSLVILLMLFAPGSLVVRKFG